jgi:hypothetical protein
MIKILQNWAEIGEAKKFLNRKGLPRHVDNPEKNWDYYLLYSIIYMELAGNINHGNA